MNRLPHIAATALSLVALCLATMACSDDSCADNSSSLPLATFYVGDAQQTITGLTVMGIGVPGDSLLAESKSLKEIYLPLQVTTGSTSFALSRVVKVDTVAIEYRDTLTLNYEATEYFHSIECGTMFNFDISGVRHTRHAIDSVVLINNLVTNTRTPSLRIHFTDLSQ